MMIGMQVDKARRQILELIGIGNLRHQDRVGLARTVQHGVEIFDPPARIEAVDPHHDFAVAEAGRERVDDGLACRGLGVRRHRVFEIENQAIGRQVAGFFQRPRIRARHIQNAAARTDGHVVSSQALSDDLR